MTNMQTGGVQLINADRRWKHTKKWSRHDIKEYKRCKDVIWKYTRRIKMCQWYENIPMMSGWDMNQSLQRCQDVITDKQEYERCQDMVTDRETYKRCQDIKAYNRLSSKKHTLWFKLLSLKKQTKNGGNTKWKTENNHIHKKLLTLGWTSETVTEIQS